MENLGLHELRCAETSPGPLVLLERALAVQERPRRTAWGRFSRTWNLGGLYQLLEQYPKAADHSRPR